MKKITLLKLTLFSTVMLFTACSSKPKKIKKISVAHPVSIYNIMGITEPKKEMVHFVTPIENQPVEYATMTNPIVETPLPEMVPESYESTQLWSEDNTYEQDEEPIVVNAEPYVSPDIEFISYRQTSFVESYQPTYTPLLVENDVHEEEKTLLNGIEWRAKSFLGTPYVWGATGPSKFDCSGFTQWVYRDVGINIPRVSRDQAKVGQYVRYEDLQRGDMVFFDTKKRRSGKVTHVGIYLGNNNFIHASSAGKKVVIYNFNQKEFYKKRFLWGRRVTNQSMRYASN